MKLSTQQEAAVDAVGKFLKSDKDVFILTGFAGTGKTSIAKHLAESVNTVFSAFTGKAAHVLTQKGCPASTIHSLIYKSTLDESTGKWFYRLNRESAAVTADLVVVDEVSMLSTVEGDNLRKLAKKILVLGDSGQLPPINDTPYFDLSKPNFHLDEIHRQAADNPIIQLATAVRQGKRLELGTYGESRVLRNRDFDNKEMLKHTQVLVGRNATRHTLNKRYRRLESRGENPEAGDRLICLRNNQERGFINGAFFTVTDCTMDSNAAALTVESADSGAESKILVFNEFFTGDEGSLTWQQKKQSDEFTYAYAITTHKAQGSTFESCLIVDESAVFKEASSKWLYTALTRASDRVTVYV